MQHSLYKQIFSRWTYTCNQNAARFSKRSNLSFLKYHFGFNEPTWPITEVLWHWMERLTVGQLNTVWIIFIYKTHHELSPRTSFLNLRASTTFEFRFSNVFRSTSADKFLRRKWNKAIWWELCCAGACHSRYFTFTFNFFPINLKVTAICQITRPFVIISHLFLCRTVTYKDIILKET